MPAQINIQGGRKTVFDVAVIRSGIISGQVMVYQSKDDKDKITIAIVIILRVSKCPFRINIETIKVGLGERDL